MSIRADAQAEVTWEWTDDSITEPSEDFEKLCSRIHEAWIREARRQGRQEDRRFCAYLDLSESDKEYDRAAARAALNFIGFNDSIYS